MLLALDFEPVLDESLTSSQSISTRVVHHLPQFRLSTVVGRDIAGWHGSNFIGYGMTLDRSGSVPA